MFGEADRGPEVRGQRHEEVEDGHQVLPVNCWSGGRKEGAVLDGWHRDPEPAHIPKTTQKLRVNETPETPEDKCGGPMGHGKGARANELPE